MLNVEETLAVIDYYNIQKDFYIKGILSVIGAITFVDLLTNQLSEINLLQLIPGSYLLFVLASFILLVSLSTFGFRVPFSFDFQNEFGTKTIHRIHTFTRLNSSFFLFVGFFLLSLNTILPIGLDSFDSYDQETLTNLWSLEEVIVIEGFLLTILVTLSQIPVYFLPELTIQKNINKLPEYWKDLSFFVFVFSGFITPTIDGYTQLNLSFSAISLYLFIITLVEKRVYIKFNSSSCLNF